GGGTRNAVAPFAGLLCDCSTPKRPSVMPASRNPLRKKQVLCRHCGRLRSTKGRRLCAACHSNPVIVSLYGPADAPGNCVFYFDTPGTLALPDTPTNALPGSPEKMRILAERAQNRRQLHHPQDASFPLPFDCEED